MAYPVLHVIERIVAPLGLRVDGSSPWVKAPASGRRFVPRDDVVHRVDVDYPPALAVLRLTRILRWPGPLDRSPTGNGLCSMRRWSGAKRRSSTKGETLGDPKVLVPYDFAT